MCRYIRVHTLYQVAKSDGRDGAGSRVVFFSAVAVAAGRRRVAKLAVQCDPQGARHYMHIHVALCLCSHGTFSSTHFTQTYNFGVYVFLSSF